jgi:Na+-translocating ferredoxin:NAD+ oxidoreductase RnfA subunit
MFSLAVCAGLSFNLILQFGLGIKALTETREGSYPIPFFQGAALFLGVFILWCVFSYVIAPLGLGFFQYVLLFPLCAFVCMGFETFFTHFLPSLVPTMVPSLVPSAKPFTPETAYNGLGILSLWLTLQLAGTPFEALVLSLCFASGAFSAMLLIHYIHKRSELEIIPAYLRGRPLTLIAAGLLSLICGSATAVLFQILGHG